ncbi:MAG: glycoside hydrolase family 3 protein [Alkalispirochaeta sp.]
MSGCASAPEGEPARQGGAAEAERTTRDEPFSEDDRLEQSEADRSDDDGAGSDRTDDPRTDDDRTGSDQTEREGSDSPGPRSQPQPPGDSANPERSNLTADAAIENLIASMTLRQRIGQMIMPGLTHDGRGRPVQEMEGALSAVIGDIEPGGIVLFGPNIATADQVRQLVRSMHEESSVPLLIAVDQEGGVVRRVVPQEGMPATEIPPARAVGRLGDPLLAYELGRVMGRELRSLGITMNFAPVADVQTNLDNPVIGSRAYGSDPELVAEMVAATVRGLQAEGVSAVVKHFPGHGDTMQDSHEEAATVAHDLARLQEIELVPFRQGIEAGADGVMIGHIAVPEVSGSPVPATLEAVLVEGLLRERLGFEGLIVTDSLVMDGLTRYFNAETIAVQAVRAGADILLLPGNPESALAAIESAVATGEISRERIDASVRRVLQTKLDRGLLEVSQEEQGIIVSDELVPRKIIMGTDEHRSLVEIIRQGDRQ